MILSSTLMENNDNLVMECGGVTSYHVQKILWMPTL